MGMMEVPPLEAGRFIYTPHPVLLDGQRNMACDLRPGESLYAFLQRHVDGLDGQAWAVSIGGRDVPRHLWHCVYPKHGQVIEVRGAVGKSALSLVAVIALTYFTFGFGTATAGMWGAGAVSSAWGGLAATGVYMAGSMLINKVLAPKLGSATSTAESVYSLSSAQNRARPYEPLGLLFGSIRVTPDLASNPYTWFEGDDQYLGMTLTPGINVERIDALYNGDTLLSSYEGVTVWHSGYSGMPDQAIPLYSNADTAQGGTLIDTSTDPKHTAGAWVKRTSSADTIRLQVNIEYLLYDTTSKGKPKSNSEQFQLQYRPAGSSTWLTWGNYTVSNSTQKTLRVTYARDVAQGQYDVRVRTAGLNTDGRGAQCNATWNTLTSVQQDTASYAGISRTGIKIKATGQLNGALQEVRGKAYAKPLQLWDGSAWQTVTAPGAYGISNPGAQILYYARGIRDDDGTLIAGMGLDDDMIDIEALKGFMLYCADNAYTYDYWITDARSHSDVLDKIALNGMGEITWAGGKLSVVWAGAEQPLSGVVNMATIKKGTFQVDYALANAADGIEYSYTAPDTLDTKTLRVPAPGITTMLNPAQVAGEGITSEAHAARMARWHLAQSLYQYKSISYDTDLEHLSYRRLSVLALQHDLTQWGYGGRVRAAVNASGTVTLTLDEPVPAPAAGNAYIGLRIPGEAIYRVFAIQPFAGETTSITLSDAWPDDAEVPGNRDGNPAWDTIWIYDFKQTPGYRVRVTGIEPESDLGGASISVVPEGPEFWNYVLTGAYTPAPNASLLPTRPVASNLRVTERNVIQGDTVYTELQVAFDISGRAVNTVVSCDVDGDGQLDEVAQTVTRSASFRIPGAGSYTLLVRPYDEDGNAGVPATIIYVTASADQPPVLVDSFTVDAIDGGLRRYTWGFNPDTIQSPDFAGVEIRYTAGAATAPDWANMTPLGDSGFHTAAFESAAPAGGEWTFACRSRNTSGTLSTAYRLQTVTLPANVGEVIGGIDTAIEQHTAALAAAQAAIVQEIADRLDGDLQAVQTAANDATAKADAARDAAIAHADVIGAQVADITGADEWVNNVAYPSGDLVKSDGKLYRAKQNVPAGTPVSNMSYWELIGNYSSLGEAVSASVRMSAQNASDIAAESSRLDAVTARMPTGTGTLATSAQVADEASTRASADTALGSRVGVVEARMPSGTDKLANEARVVSAETASVGRDNALGTRIGVVEARMPDGTGALATAASVTSVDQASVARDSAIGQQISTTNANLAATTSTANAAQTAANNAATAAGNKGKVLYGSSAPAAEDQLAQNLWIDTAGGANTPKRWNGTAWVAVTDKAATDAAAAAANALSVANTKADASTVSSLQSQVTQQGNTITAQGSALTAVKAQLTGSANLAPNAALESDLMGWTIEWDSAGAGFQLYRDRYGWVYPGGRHVFDIATDAKVPAGSFIAVTGARFPVDGGKRYCIQGRINIPSNTDITFGLIFYNSAGTASEAATNYVGALNWSDCLIFKTAPADAVEAVVWFRGHTTAAIAGVTFSAVNIMVSAATADQTVAAPWSPPVAGIDSKYASVTQSMQAQVTSQGNNLTSILAQYFLAVNAAGKVAGMKIGSNGTTGSVEFLADIFRVIASGDAGMEWQANYLRTYGTGFQFVIGTGFGVGGKFAMWFGPNVGAAACDTSNAISYSTIAGYQQTSGVIKGGLLSASAMEIGSTRIHTDGGRLAPFSVQDMSFSSINGSGWQNFTQTVDGFVGPNNGSGYHAKRFSAQRMDVILDVLCAGSRNTETVVLEVQYDGGSWSGITSVNMDVSNKAMIPLMIRYTTLDTWSTLAFRARTTNGNSQALSIKVSVWNYNQSANAAGSNSGTTGSGSGGGSLPPSSGGGGGSYCVDWDTVLPDGRLARDLQPGDLAECVDVPTGTREWIALRAIAFGEADCYAVRTAHGEVIQSDTTPMVMRDGSIVLTPDLDDRELLTHAHGFERARIERIGRRKVVKVDFGNRMFFAGTRPDNAIATHNIKIMEP